ncbi:MAG: DNA topoisomerase III, partial [Proteobacteria bacterium]
MKLIIAEKPSVARDLAQALGIKPSGRGSFTGRDYIVTWAVGHLVTLAEPHQINPVWQKWRESDLPILPTHWPLSVLEGTAQQFEEIRRLMHAPEVSSLIAATDAGREGELIFRYIYEKAECRKPVERLWLSSLTPESIHDAFRSMRPLSAYDNLANNARGRSRSDWLVGLNFSRAYSLKQNDRWTVGRVQTPTLAMVVERTEAIQSFVAEPYVEIEARFATERSEEYRGIYFEAKTKDLAKGEAKRFSPGEVSIEDILSRAKRGQARIKKRDDKQQKIPPPKLYDLTELQKDANRLFGFQAKYTLDLSQSLYEVHKLLTYPRSDSRYLSSSVASTLPGIVEVIRQGYQDVDLRSDTGVRALGPAFVDDKKVSDHHAIIPTGKDPRSVRMSGDEAKVFDLVAKRLLMAWQDDLIKSQSTVVTEILCDGLSDTYKSSGMIVLQEGWRALERRTRAAEALALPFVREAEDVSVKKVESLKKETKPPPAFSDATLLNGMASAGSRLDDKELEGILREKGLGTPATRAATIETLITRKYVERREKQLWATELGCALIHAVHPSVCSAALTGEWEAKLRRIEAGELTLDVFMREIESYVKETVEMIRESQPVRSVGRSNAESTRALRPKESFDAVSRRGGDSARDAGALFASPVSLSTGDSFASRDGRDFVSSSSTSGTHASTIHVDNARERDNAGTARAISTHSSKIREGLGNTIPNQNTQQRQGATAQLTAISQFTGSLKDALYKYFNHREFREHQEQICREIIEGNDLLLVMPTGAGKSLCYQLPAIVLDGCTIVISPLIALMDDQVEKLKSLGIAAGALHSGLSRDQSRALCVDYQEGRLKLLYIAPERLGLSGFADFLARTPPSLIAIDEAHCISQWGHDFRPDYRMLAQRLLKLRPAPIVAMTATATPLVQKDIAVQLDLRNPSLHIHGFRRTNIAIEISEVSLPDRPQLTEQLLSKPGARPAIVYAPTRKDTESVSQRLTGRVAAYHAGLSHETRQQVQRDFQAGKLDVIVATIAFGMGIDK